MVPRTTPSAQRLLRPALRSSPQPHVCPSRRLLLTVPQLLPSNSGQRQAHPQDVRSLSILCLPPSLDPHYSPSPTRKTKLLPLCSTMVLYHHFFHTFPPPEMPRFSPVPLQAHPHSYLSFKPRLTRYILQDAFLVVIRSLPPWSTLSVALSWRASHFVMHQSRLPTCLVIPNGP